MFALPPLNGAQIRILGIDPGSDTMGFGVIHCDAHTLQITACEAFTVQASRLPGRDWLGSIHGDRMRRLYTHADHLSIVLGDLQPAAVASEAPFYNPRMPGAFAPLVETMYTLRQTVAAHDPWMQLYTITPSQVKNGVGAAGGGNKDAVKKAILEKTPLASCCLGSIEQYDEHSVDGLAVAYVMHQMIFTGDFSRAS